MNKEEILNKYIDLIDKGYCCACNELNCIDNFPHAKITHAIRELQQENKKYKEVIDKANKKLNNFIECCKAEKLESGSDYLHHQYWDMFERFNKQIKDILKEVSE